MRALLFRTPLYAPEVFPRTVTVYVASETPESPSTYVDINAQRAAATVLASGNVPLGALRHAIAAAASTLHSLGGYQSVKGGSAQSPNLAAARSDGVLEWYARDGHVYSKPGATPPDLLTLRGAAVMLPAAGNATAEAALVIGATTGILENAAAGAQRLLAAHHVVWHRSADTKHDTLAPLWAGASLHSNNISSSSDAPRGAIVHHDATNGTTTTAALSFSNGFVRFAAGPRRVIVIDRHDNDAVAAGSADTKALASSSAAFNELNAAKLAARVATIDSNATIRVRDEAAAASLLNLTL